MDIIDNLTEYQMVSSDTETTKMRRRLEAACGRKMHVETILYGACEIDPFRAAVNVQRHWRLMKNKLTYTVTHPFKDS